LNPALVMPFSCLDKLFLVIVFILMILNPYTLFGNLGYFIAVPFLLISVFSRFRYLAVDFFSIIFVMALIAMVGVIVSFTNNIGQFNHLKVVFSLLVYVLMAHGVFIYFRKRSLDFNDFVYCALLAIGFNGLVIIVEVFFPGVRDVIESVLVASGNIDWQEGYRYRGLASGGGASLSVLAPVAAVMALHLYKEKYIGSIILIASLSVLIFSLIFIGRTGIILLPLVFLSFMGFYFKRYFLRTVFLFISITLLIGFGFEYFKQVIVGQHGVGFFNYSLGFLLEGSEGIKDEGTVSVILEFLKVMPTTFPEMLIGYGFYGGSDFSPWTDSGYSRMFLSVGYFFGVIFYACFFLLFRNVFLYKPFFFITIGLLLLVAEAKEPLLFTGYSSRIYFIFLVIGLIEKKLKQRKDRIIVKNIQLDGFVTRYS
jgi:hypothetical protein